MNKELTDLIGAHALTGVDMSTERMETWASSGRFEDCNVINFTLDGITYTACEDPDDGYRSSLRYLRQSDEPTKNQFAPVRVVGRMKENGSHEVHNVLQLVDVLTGGIVLEVGTGNADDYYPYFVGSFYPQEMAPNKL